MASLMDFDAGIVLGHPLAVPPAAAAAGGAPPMGHPPPPFQGGAAFAPVPPLLPLGEVSSFPSRSPSSSPHWISDENFSVLEEMLRRDHLYPLLPPDAIHLRHRPVLCEWVADLGTDFGLTPNTTNLAILYCDRVLAAVVVPKTSLQLVAVCCVLIAGEQRGEEGEGPRPRVRVRGKGRFGGERRERGEQPTPVPFPLPP